MIEKNIDSIVAYYINKIGPRSREISYEIFMAARSVVASSYDPSHTAAEGYLWRTLDQLLRKEAAKEYKYNYNNVLISFKDVDGYSAGQIKVDDYHSVRIKSLTCRGIYAIAVCAEPHYLNDGDFIKIKGARPRAYNLETEVEVINSHEFQYKLLKHIDFAAVGNIKMHYIRPFIAWYVLPTCSIDEDNILLERDIANNVEECFAHTLVKNLKYNNDLSTIAKKANMSRRTLYNRLKEIKHKNLLKDS